MVIRQIKIYLFIYLNYYINTDTKNVSNLKKNTEKNRHYLLYEENSKNGQIIWNDKDKKYEYIYLGIIDNILFENIDDKIKNEILEKLQIYNGDELNFDKLKLILIQLKNLYKIDFTYKIESVKDQSDRFIIKFHKKTHHNKYFISEINIISSNEHLLSKKKIEHVVYEVISTNNFLHKLLYFLFKKSKSEFYENEKLQHLEYVIKQLSEKYLILGTEVRIFFEIDANTNQVIVNIYVEVGQKYWIENIDIKDGLKISKFNIKELIFHNGMQNESFKYLEEEIINQYNINTNINFIKNKEKPTLNIFIEKEDTIKVLKIANIQYAISSIKLNQIIPYMPIEIGGMLDELALKKFCYKLSLLFKTDIKYEILPCGDNNQVIIKIIENESDKKYDIISFHPDIKISYPFKITHIIYGILKFTPKITLDIINNNLLKNNHINNKDSMLGFGCDLSYLLKFSKDMNLYVFNIDSNFILKTEQFIKSIKIILFNYIYNNPLQEYELNLYLFNVQKYFHPLMKKDLNEYIYYYSSIHLFKKFQYNFSEKIVIGIKGDMFFESKAGKLILEFCWNKDLEIFSHDCRILIVGKFITNTIDIKKLNHFNIFKHRLFINKKDNATGPLSSYHNNEKEAGFNSILFSGNNDEKEQDFINAQNFLQNKGIVLSNNIFNIYFVLAYKIIKTHLPYFGYIYIYYNIFIININYDITHNLWRISYGTGLMGQYKNTRIFLSFIGGVYNANGIHADTKNIEDNQFGLKFATENINI